MTKRYFFVVAGLAPALAEPQDPVINFEINYEIKPFPVRPGRGQAPTLQIKHFFVTPRIDSVYKLRPKFCMHAFLHYIRFL